MTNSRFLKVCGIGSLLAVLSYIGTVIFSSIAGLSRPDDLDGFATFLTNWDNAKHIMSAYGWAGILGSLFTVPLILGYYQLLRKQGPLHWIPVVIIFHGVFLLTLAYIVPLIISHTLAPMYLLESDPGAKQSIAAIVQTLVVMEDFFLIIGTVITLPTGISIMAIIDYKESIVPKWINWIAIVTGILGIFTLGTFADGIVKQVFDIIFIVTLVLMLAWMGIIGVYMMLPQAQKQES
ncbi:MAG: hypothetical protein FK733_07225 [Asgard group archaeon]|nr:hypothetical protein [Asgard group archaeon]